MSNLLEKIKNSYVLEIHSNTEFFRDDYENEEILDSYNYQNDSKIYYNLNILENLEDYIENVLYADFRKERLKDSIFYYEGMGRNYFYYSNFVNSDNMTPSETEIDKWRNGEIDLYKQLTRIFIKINGLAITIDDIIEYCYK